MDLNVVDPVDQAESIKSPGPMGHSFVVSRLSELDIDVSLTRHLLPTGVTTAFHRRLARHPKPSGVTLETPTCPGNTWSYVTLRLESRRELERLNRKS